MSTHCRVGQEGNPACVRERGRLLKNHVLLCSWGLEQAELKWLREQIQVQEEAVQRAVGKGSPYPLQDMSLLDMLAPCGIQGMDVLHGIEEARGRVVFGDGLR